MERSALQNTREPAGLATLVHRIEARSDLDPPADRLGRMAATVADGHTGDVLRGRPIGHALHPLLTDLPLGCWMSAALLDLFGGRSARSAARRLVGVGLLTVPATVLSGLADYDTIRSKSEQRVATVHAIGNGVVAMLYLGSWVARRRGSHRSGAALGLTGGLLASATGYLGGHLSFGRGVGVGDRGLDGP